MRNRYSEGCGRWLVLTVVCAAMTHHPLAAQDTSVAGETQQDLPPASQPAEAKQTPPYTSRAWAVKRETEPPGYVKTLDQLGMDWLEFGLEHRTRYELRDDDYRRPKFETDEPIQLWTHGYLGVRKILDPFRIGFEFNDARQFNSKYPDTVTDVDENDILQLFGELYFEDLLGADRPARFQAGRMTMEYLNYRLMARSRWRGPLQSFDGMRLTLGQPTADWQFDVFAAQPVERRLRQPDRTDEERWFYGMVGAWRKWSKLIIFEPYYFILDEDMKDRAVNDREIHTLGLRSFGLIGDSGFDYETDFAFQFGKDGDLKHRAFGCTGEVGYTFQHAWKPRLSSWTVYASGDRNPNDGTNDRFDNLFGAGSSHTLSMTDLIVFRNLVSTKIRLEMAPLKNLLFDTSYGGYWLASDSDAWIVAGRRDPTGRSGDCIGTEWDARIRYKLDPRAELEVGYAHLFPGQFVKNTGPADGLDFLYVSMTVRLP